MVHILGDIHGNIIRLENILKSVNLSNEDTVIILGDFGGNYYGDNKDAKFKKQVNKIGCKFFILRGNHDMNPAIMPSMKTIFEYGDNCYREEEYPNILYAMNGKVYTIEKKTYLTIGGAYSIDKEYRLAIGAEWFADEELSEAEQDEILNNLPQNVDYVLTHTCPYAWLPVELFISGVSRQAHNYKTEHFLTDVELALIYKHWFFGHFHGDKHVNDFATIIYNGYCSIGKDKIYYYNIDWKGLKNEEKNT